MFFIDNHLVRIHCIAGLSARPRAMRVLNPLSPVASYLLSWDEDTPLPRSDEPFGGALPQICAKAV